MSWQQARAALNTHLSETPGIDWSTVKLPGYIVKPQTEPYWKVDILPAGVNPEMVGSDHEYGIYQVSRWVPAGKGIASALDDAQAVIDWFKRRNLSGVSCGVPTLAFLQQPDWLHVPVSIPFQVL